MIPLVDLKLQYSSIRNEINQAIQRVIDHTEFIQGQEVEKFEGAFSAISGGRYGVATSSGTTALHLALTALHIGPGAEVITVPNTFIATTEAVTQARGSVRFVDVDPVAYTIDVNKIEAAITRKTKAIIPVHLYGCPCDMDPILAIAKRYDLKVIVDAAQAHMASYKGRPIGQYGDAVCFSFYPGKNLGAYGDAGMVVTHDEELASKMRMLANHGRISKYEHLWEGFNYRMDELQAAVLNVKLKYLLKWTHRRRQIACQYNRLLSKMDMSLPQQQDDARHVYHQYVIAARERDKVKEALAQEGIMTGIHYPIPLHLQKAYQYLGYSKGSFPVAERLSARILSLPIFPELTDRLVYRIASSLRKVCDPLSLDMSHSNV